MDFSVDGILERMKGELKNEDTKIEGSFSMDNLQAVAEELGRLHATQIIPIYERLSDKEEDMGTSGNEKHYVRWAKEVKDRNGLHIVGNAKVSALRDGTGLVSVAIVTKSAKSPTEEEIRTVQAYIDDRRPIGAKPTVIAATGVDVEIACTVTLQPGYSATGVKKEVEKKITEYLSENAFKPGLPTLNYYKITNIVSAVDGIIDLVSLDLNGKKENLSSTYDKFFTLKGVVVNGT